MLAVSELAFQALHVIVELSYELMGIGDSPNRSGVENERGSEFGSDWYSRSKRERELTRLFNLTSF